MDTFLRLFIVSFACLANTASWADGKPPSIPEISYSIYSGTAAELFWSRSTDDNINIVYSLERDGRKIYSGNGLSFFDDSLTTDTPAIYSLTAKGNDGLVTAAVSITLKTNEAPVPAIYSVLPPAGLRADTYSSTSFELFWDRVVGERLDYEISQQGEILGVTNGTSFYLDSGFEAGVDFEFEVKAVRSYGSSDAVYSEPARVSVQLPDANAQLEPETDQPLQRPPRQPLPLPPTPPAPTNIKLVKYSTNAAELFWDRPLDIEGVVATEVFRNGELIATVAGPSFYDDTRLRGITYAYKLVAINNLGEKSSPSLFPSQIVLSDPAYFKEVVFNSEYGDSVSRIRKWRTNINYVVLGDVSVELLAELDRVVAELNSLVTIKLVEVDDESEANYRIFFGSGEDYANTIEEQATDLVEYNFGLAWSYWNGNFEIFKGSMYVDIYRTSNVAQRKHLLREELTQSLGIFTDSLKYPDSIFYQVFTETNEFASVDREVIRALYRSEVKVGMDEDALDRVLGID